MVKILPVVLEYLKDVFSNFCILEKRKVEKLSSHFLLIWAKEILVQDLGTAILNCCSYLIKECCF